MYTLTRSDGTAASEHCGLAAAMTGAGYPEPAAWKVTPGLPDQIHTGPAAVPRPGGRDTAWVIGSPGVAHQLIDLLPGEECSRRTWSGQDMQVSAAVMSALAASARAFDAGARLAAHYTAAGELDWARISAVLTGAFTPAGPAGAPAVIDEWLIGEVAAALAQAGITVRPATAVQTLHVPSAAADVPAALTVVSSGPGKPAYRVWRATAGYRGPGWGKLAGHYSSLHAAMIGAGYPSYHYWGTKTGMPDVLFLDEGTRDDDQSWASCASPWTIEAPGVAGEFAETCHPLVRAALRWSPFDDVIVTAVISETCERRSMWRLPFAAACDAGARLAARYGTSSAEGGSLTTVDVFTVISVAYADAYAPSREVPADILEDVAAQLVRRLRDGGLNMVGALDTLQSPWVTGHGEQISARGRKALGPRAGNWPTALLAGMAAARGREARGDSRPARTIPVTGRRLTAEAAAALVYLISVAIVIGCATGLSWPAGLWRRWVFWFAVAAAVAVAGYKLIGIRLRTADSRSRKRRSA